MVIKNGYLWAHDGINTSACFEPVKGTCRWLYTHIGEPRDDIKSNLRVLNNKAINNKVNGRVSRKLSGIYVSRKMVWVNQAFDFYPSMILDPRNKTQQEVRLYQRHATRVPKVYVYDHHGKLIKFSRQDPLSLILAEAYGVYSYRPEKNEILLALEKKIVCVHADNLKILWQYEVEHPIESSLIVTPSSIGYAYKDLSNKRAIHGSSSRHMVYKDNYCWIPINQINGKPEKTIVKKSVNNKVVTAANGFMLTAQQKNRYEYEKIICYQSDQWLINNMSKQLAHHIQSDPVQALAVLIAKKNKQLNKKLTTEIDKMIVAILASQNFIEKINLHPKSLLFIESLLWKNKKNHVLTQQMIKDLDALTNHKPNRIIYYWVLFNSYWFEHKYEQALLAYRKINADAYIYWLDHTTAPLHTQIISIADKQIHIYFQKISENDHELFSQFYTDYQQKAAEQLDDLLQAQCSESFFSEFISQYPYCKSRVKATLYLMEQPLAQSSVVWLLNTLEQNIPVF